MTFPLFLEPVERMLKPTVDGRQYNLALPLELDKGQNFLHQRSARVFPRACRKDSPRRSHALNGLRFMLC